MSETCPTCDHPTATADDVIAGRARYADTQGGHNDRHTLVLEAAERAITEAKEAER